MEGYGTSLALIGLMFLFLGLGVWIFAGVLLVALAGMIVLHGFPLERAAWIAKSILFRSSTTWELASVPLFIFIGELVFRTDISERLFHGLSPLVQRIPGRLLHTNIGACTLFAAVCGSSAATAATVGRITVTALEERGYDRDLSIGSLAGAGTLGLMIPPSIVMIVYGVMAEVSVAKLFIAGILPGLLIASVFSFYIAMRCLVNPKLAPEEAVRPGLGAILEGLSKLVPVLVLIGIVLGGIYSGIATPSEAAALGVVATVGIGLVLRQLNWRVLRDALVSSVRLSCMVLTITVAAAVLSSAVGYLHVAADLARALNELQVGPWGLILILAVLYTILGCFLDGISITVMTIPIVLPLVVAAGFDALWFGIFLVVMVELGQVTPPVGFNLFVLQGLTGRPIGQIARASLPFIGLLLAALAIITMFPGIALWLPRTLLG